MSEIRPLFSMHRLMHRSSSSVQLRPPSIIQLATVTAAHRACLAVAPIVPTISDITHESDPQARRSRVVSDVNENVNILNSSVVTMNYRSNFSGGPAPANACLD